MPNRFVVSLLISFLSCISYSTWSIASGGCRVDKGIAVPVSTASITFKDGSIRLLKGIDLQYEYVLEADKQYLSPAKHRVKKREIFVGLCAPGTADELKHAEKAITKISLEFEAEYSYTPDRVRLVLTNGKEYVVKGSLPYGPLVPTHDFLANTSEGVAAPDISAFRLLLTGTDVDAKKSVSAVIYDATERHDSDIQIVSIQIQPKI
jgi:hypothetical protein